MMMNKRFMMYVSIVLCFLNRGAFGVGERSKLGLHSKLPKINNMFTPQQWTGVKVVSGLAGTAAISYAADKYVGQGNGKQFYNGQYAWGFAQTLKLSSVCLSVAPMMNERWGDQFFRFGTRGPIVSLAAIAVTHPSTQKIAAHTPFLGDHISTYDKEGKSKCGTECAGICTRCFLPKTLLVVGLYKAIDPLVDQIATWVGKQTGFIHEDENSDN